MKPTVEPAMVVSSKTQEPQLPVTEQLFARVAVNQPVDGIFEYFVPETMREAIRVGGLVRVPFGPRLTAACVVELSPTAQTDLPPERFKSVRSLVSPSYYLDEELIKLGQWISSYYLAPIGEVLGALSFIGYNDIDENVEVLLNLAPDWEHLAITDDGKKHRPLTDKQQGVIKASENAGATTLPQLAKAAGVGPSVIQGLIRRGLLQKHVRVVERRDEYSGSPEILDVPLNFNPAQAVAYDHVLRALESRQATTFLLYGVTGSGKTEVYLQAIAHTLRDGGTAAILVPEIALTPQTVARFRRRFGELVGVYHSRLTIGQKFDLWRRVKSGECRVMIGARSALFTPFRDLRVIVIDEEHETSYKQDSTPRYHARDAAIVRAQMDNAIVILGSATPSVETYYKALSGKFEMLSLPERVEAYPLPIVEVLNMTQEAKDAQNPDMFSARLKSAIAEKLERNEQVLLFLNRRGYFNFMVCLDCSTVAKCKHCDVALTHHKPRNILVCHYCSREYMLGKECAECGSSELSLVGLGTQRVEERLHELFPKARIARVDLDTTRKRTSILDLWRKIEQGDFDIILGTQMIAKGVHLENVTLVGVPLADVSLFQPDFRSAERAFSMLTQVAGRAGRGEKKGEVIIQTYVPHHYAIDYAKTHDYRGFYDKEIRIRQILRFPPFFRLASVLALGEDPGDTADMAGEFARCARETAFRMQDRVQVLGPTPAPIGKIRDQYRWRLLIRAADHRDIKTILAHAQEQYRTIAGHSRVQMIVDIDPFDLL